ncbi:MAG: riboflavin synthase [Acidobacteriota bacterium]
MFTGIVTGTGRVLSLTRRAGGARLSVIPPRREEPFRRGESVSVSGVCLTALAAGRRFQADLSSETLARTSLGLLRPGDLVNLERALRWGDRLSGHFVLGHVDAVARLRAIRNAGACRMYRFAIPRGLARYVVEKGSVALDGVSLTVARRRPWEFDVAVIPETLRKTTLSHRRPGQIVNFEADVFARYGRAGALARARREASRR